MLKTIVSIVLGLYSTRVILKGLGESDFGIYMLLAGIVGMLSFLNNALSATTQRFLSYNQNISSISYIKTIFANSVLVHISLAIVCFITLEIVGLFLFDGQLNIPPERIPAAKFVYHCAIVMAVLTLLAAPFRAMLISHENMIFTSFIDIIDAVLKLIIAFVVLDSEIDHLRLYALLMIGISAFTLISFSVYSFFCYDEFSLPTRRSFRKDIISQITKFAGWSLYSSFCIIGRNQGLAVVINKFFGTVINASYGIAIQVSGAVNYLSSSFLNSIAPPLIRAEGAGNRNLVIQLAISASKISYVIMAMVVVPLIMRLDIVLAVWLGEVPEYSALFCTVIMISALIDQLSTGLSIANKACGKLKKYSLMVDSMKLLVIPLFFALLLLRVPLSISLWIYAAMEIVGALNRIYVMKSLIGISFSIWFRKVFAALIIPTIVLVGLYFIAMLFVFDWVFYILQIVVITIIYLAVTYFVSTDKFEKHHINILLSKIHL